VTQAPILVVLDVDSTLTRNEGIDLLAAEVSGDVAAEVSAITEQAMRGELDFEQSLKRRVAALKGTPEKAINRAAQAQVLTDGARHLVKTLVEQGHFVGAVSGGFHEMVDPLAETLGLSVHRANRLGVSNAVLTGELVGPIIDARAKAEALEEWAGHFGVPMSNTVAIGDGGNDVLMLEKAALGIAFMAKPVAKKAADVSIDTPDLAQVLSLLGFLQD
jgi:phosphoserine phosphatase